ncbi:Major facilitator superfamily (MFS) profile domain-containing protein [Caenorhabditis elegans]|uniref:Major facilitator superfamily (MFS) profile domain-containing protein n=1 Tax=Caenorhabditis elegans TaxID=6239 RepID=Q10048_CAEEL|nr:Major facilitator superfamily (MFS) profile domain-containing protein [Caenorhabditis elegans]CAA87340.1 Major facilitator superfamily (MFS) profile domain-containing protein [Caenorhabditis elegans]|eukprot:NP_509639.1 SLC (SoLute Carrier) homolog [Caenorhabditis elegans]
MDSQKECVFVSEKSKIFPSTRLFFSFLLCLCFVALAIGTSNISQSMVCMVKKPDTNYTCPLAEPEVEAIPCNHPKQFAWSSIQQGLIYSGQNFGSLFMVITGWQADRLNGKWTIVAAMAFIIVSNAVLPISAGASFALVFFLRVLTGFGDALLSPASSSLITRWFPPKERPSALGIVTSGRQIGTLIILPIGGWLCGSDGSKFLGGWPAIFYLSSVVAAAVLVIWVVFSADKPSKHLCISHNEEAYINRKIEEENIGKRNNRKNTPWKAIFTSKQVWVAVAALVCHEFPLVIMLQFLPKFFSDVLGLSNTVNGLVSALPMAILFLSKCLSASLASYLTANGYLRKTQSCKIFNFIASLGLGICIAATPLMSNLQHAIWAIIILCLANAFAGLHTPGVLTAIVQLAPAFSGIITGLAFAVASCFSIFNKLLISQILRTGSKHEWTIVFEISAFVAILPTIFFTLWGSAERTEWASNRVSVPKDADQKSNDSGSSTSSTIQAIAKYSMFLSHDLTNSA